MAQEPIFSAPDPRTQNLFARYTQEQVPVLPAGYLESFATAAKLRQDEANNARANALEREKAAMLYADKGADRKLDYAKLDVAASKEKNEAGKIALQIKDQEIKTDTEKRKATLEVQKFQGESINSALDILRGQKSDIDRQILDDGDETDAEKKLKPEQLNILKSQSSQFGSRINSLGNRYLNLLNIGNDSSQQVNPEQVALEAQRKAKQNEDRQKEIMSNNAYNRAKARFQSSGSTNPQLLQNYYQQEIAIEKQNQKKTSDNTGPVSLWDGLTQEPNVAMPQLQTGNPGDLMYPVSENVGLPSELDDGIDNHVNKGFIRGQPGTSQTTINSSIIYNPKENWYQASINPEAKDQNTVSLNRQMEMAAWMLNSGVLKKVNVKVDDEDQVNAATLVGHNDNLVQIPEIAKALKVVNLIQSSHKTGKYDPVSDSIGLQFQDKYGLSPMEFLIGGRGAVTNSNVLAPANLNDVSLKSQDISEKISKAVSNRPTITEVNSADIEGRVAAITKRMETNSKLIQSNPGETATKRLTAENTDLTRQLTALNSRLSIVSSQREVNKQKEQLWQSEITAYKSEQDSVSSALATKGKVAELRKIAVAQAKTFPGLTPESRESNFGYVNAALTKPSKVSIQVPEFDAQGNRTGKLINVKLNNRELLLESIKRGDPDIASSVLVYGLDDKQMDYKDAANENFSRAILPTRELAKFTKSLDKENFLTSAWRKLTDNEVNSLTEYRSNIIAAVRTEKVGGGNPSNFEQEMLQDTIPDPSKLGRITARDVLRWKNIGLMLAVTHNIKMKNVGLEMTEDTLNMYNNQLKDVVGKNMTKEEIQGLRQIYENGLRVYQDRSSNESAKKEATESINKAFTRAMGKELPSE
jgi:hypothetical protein